MKTILFTLALSMFCSMASAADISIKGLVIRKGKTSIRVNVNDGYKNRPRYQQYNQDLYVCSVQAFLTRFDSDKHELLYDAKRDATLQCERQYHQMHCGNISCQKIR